MKRVLDVGNCGPDFYAVRRLIEGNFDGVKVQQAYGADDALTAIRSGEFNLVLVNRKLDRDYSDGLEVIKALNADPTAAKIPVIMLTNYPEFQAQAIAVGAEPGFGKSDFDASETRAILNRFLS